MLIVLGPEEPEQDRQADRPTAQALKLDHQDDDHPTVAPAGAPPGPFGLGAVVQVVRAPHPPPRAAEQRVIDGQADRRARLDEHRDQKVGQPQAQLVGLPARPGEEVVRATVMPHAGPPGGLQHARDGAVADAAGEPDHQHAERLKRRLRETRSQQGQQPGKRSGNLAHGGDPPVKGPRPASSAPRGPMGLNTHRIRGRRQPSFACSGAQTDALSTTRAGHYNHAPNPQNHETREDRRVDGNQPRATPFAPTHAVPRTGSRGPKPGA